MQLSEWHEDSKVGNLIDKIITFGTTEDDVVYNYLQYTLSLLPNKMIVRDSKVILEIYDKTRNIYQV